MSETIAYLGLGTNLGDRLNNLRRALASLTTGPRLRLLRCSQVYETEPWGIADQPLYLNCVAEVATELSPDELLGRCKEAEELLGRQPGPRWGPRIMDVDILLYGQQVIDLPHLEIPHPRLHLRAFALIPLAELVGDVVHPVLNQPVGDLARGADGQDGVTAVGTIELALESADC